jgi:pyruvate kinase
MRKAKIVCTIRPASKASALSTRLIENGMDAARGKRTGTF